MTGHTNYTGVSGALSFLHYVISIFVCCSPLLFLSISPLPRSCVQFLCDFYTASAQYDGKDEEEKEEEEGVEDGALHLISCLLVVQLYRGQT
jgi:hypothetical protein